MISEKILVVDDESSIRKTLEGILTDEGFGVELAADAETAFKYLAQSKPALVLLDIWLPGMDGIEALECMRRIYPDVPVVMISGHATIATAVSATRLGASDFIEKPLDLHVTLAAIRKAISTRIISTNGGSLTSAPVEELTFESSKARVNPQVFLDPLFCQPQSSFTVKQKTLAKTIIMYGQGLHSGKKSGLILEPLPENSGIHFAAIAAETEVVPAHVDFIESTGFATTVKLGGTQAGTIEHLMSALHAYGITNLLIKCNGEVPVFDGSALEFCHRFDEVGVIEQAGNWYGIKITETLEFSHGKEVIKIEPAEDFSIDYTLEYPEPIGNQHFNFTLSNPEDYKREIAGARTFGFVKDIGYLQKQGLALGGRFDNFVLIGAQGAINGEMRFANEPVRHKILDAIGDLYLLSRPIRGRVTARMTGHSDNISLLKKIFAGLGR